MATSFSVGVPTATPVGVSTTTITTTFAFADGSTLAQSFTLSNITSQLTVQTFDLGAVGNIIKGAATVTANEFNAPQLLKSAGCILIPPSGSTATLTLKGVTGDAGIVIHKTAPTLITFDGASPPASFCITATATVTGFKIAWF